MVELRIIDESNFKECLKLHTSVENADFVDSVVYSLAEAWLFYKDTKPFAIYENDRVVGFVSMYSPYFRRRWAKLPRPSRV